MNPITFRNGLLIALLSSISGLVMAQAGTATAPMPEATVPPLATVTIPPENLAPSPPTGMPMDNPEQRALASCESKAVADRETCRDRVKAHYESGRPGTAISE